MQFLSTVIQATRKTTDVFQHGERKVIYWQIVWQFHEHYLPSLLACTVCRVESRIHVIYANFSTHRQDVRAETRIYQSVATFNHTVWIHVCCYHIILFLAVRCWVRLGLALLSICFNMCRVVCSEILHVTVFLWHVVCRFMSHLLDGIVLAILLWSPSQRPVFLSSWWQLIGCFSAPC